MLRGSKTVLDKLPPEAIPTRREVAVQMGGRLLMMLIGVLQLVMGTTKSKNQQNLRGRN